ncbi:hypothetical protein T06_14066, partial [Trichinella sp. T6]
MQSSHLQAVSLIRIQVVKKEPDVNSVFQVTTRQAYISQYDRKTNCASPMTLRTTGDVVCELRNTPPIHPALSLSYAPDTSEDNRTELLTAFPKEEVSTDGQREIRKNLGIHWKKDEDILTFKPPPNLNTQSRSTMRQMLSHAARVYDPLGAHSTVYWPDATVVSALFGIKPDSAERVREFQPFLDQDGLLRVGARLRRSTLPPESKHPIILPHNHPIVRDRNATKKGIRSCPVCRRVDAQPYRLRMVVLPADRVAETPPFIHTGVDFSGPLFIRPDSGTSRALERADNTQFLTRSSEIYLPQRPTQKILTGRNSSASSTRNASGGNSSQPEPLGAAATRKDSSVLSRMRYERQFEEPSSNVTCFTPFCVKSKRASMIDHCRELSRLPSVSTGIHRRNDTTSGVNNLIRRWRYQQRLTAKLWKRWKQQYVTTLTTRGRWRKTQQEPRVGDIVGLLPDAIFIDFLSDYPQLSVIPLSKLFRLSFEFLKNSYRSISQIRRVTCCVDDLSHEIFDNLFLKAAELGVVLQPQTVICDFETALIPAVQASFPGVQIQGCYFHFCQAVLRKVAELGLRTRYLHETETKKKIKMLMATAFLPLPEVPAAVDLLGRNVTGLIAALFDYFRREWMTPNRLPLWNRRVTCCVDDLSHEIFDNLFLKAAELGVVLQPQTVICDFETALIPAVQASFPGVQIQGCYFHFCQAVLRKVAELGLRT